MSKIYRAGDEIIITEEMLTAVEESVSWKDSTFRERFPPGTKGVCYPQRINRTTGQLCIRWDTPDGPRETNVSQLKKAGLEFKHPEFEELPLMECDESLLGTEELVEKGMRLAGISEAEADYFLEKVAVGMSRYNVVFYIP